MVASVSASLADAALRSEGVRRLAARVASEGSGTLRTQADRLGVPVGALRNYLGGFPVPDEVARDIEWTLHLPTGWLDGQGASESIGLATNENAKRHTVEPTGG